MDYLQVALTSARDSADTMSELLEEAGALSVTIESANEEEVFDAAQPRDPLWMSQRLTALFGGGFDATELSGLLQHHPQATDVSVSRLPDQDWERNWLEQFQPVKVGCGLWVCPSWLTPPDPEAVNLVIDPGLAFGTGTHQTTHLCLDYLSKADLDDKLVVDFGCGSGILGIAALKLGAAEAIAIDVDPKALDASRSNAAINGVADQFKAGFVDDAGRLLDGRSAQLVIANILADTLVDLRETLKEIASDGAVLLLSGVLEHQADRVIKAFDSGFRFIRYQKDDWMLLVGDSGGNTGDATDD